MTARLITETDESRTVSLSSAESSPPAMAVATKIMARKRIPLPMNTDAKSLSSCSPNVSRSTPRNHRKAILANDSLLLILALVFFTVSVAADFDMLPGGGFTVEDGAKLMGIVSWFTYFVRFSAREARSFRAGGGSQGGGMEVDRA